MDSNPTSLPRNASADLFPDLKPVPFSRDMLVQLLWATLVPFVPLVFTMIPFESLLDHIFKSIF